MNIVEFLIESIKTTPGLLLLCDWFVASCVLAIAIVLNIGKRACTFRVMVRAGSFGGLLCLPLLIDFSINGSLFFHSDNYQHTLIPWLATAAIAIQLFALVNREAESQFESDEYETPTGGTEYEIVTRMAATLSLPKPRVTIHNPTIADSVHASSYSIWIPSVLLSQRLIDRLSPEELASTIVHELQHYRNATEFWYAAALTAGVCTPIALAPILSEPLRLTVAIALALTVSRGLFLFASRRCEYDCDRMAAQICGSDVEVASLRKLYSDYPRDWVGKSFLYRFLEACSTHPSLEERVYALSGREIHGDARAAPTVDQRNRSRRTLAIMWWMAVGLIVVSAERPFVSIAIAAIFVFTPNAVRQVFDWRSKQQASKIDHNLTFRRYPLWVIGIPALFGIGIISAEILRFRRWPTIDMLINDATLFALISIALPTAFLYRFRFRFHTLIPAAQLVSEGEYEEGLAALEKQQLTEKAVDLASLYQLEALSRLSRYDELLKQSTACVERNPIVPQFVIMQAFAASQLGLFEKQLTFAATLETLLPSDFYSHFYLTNALCALSRFDEAEQALPCLRTCDATEIFAWTIEAKIATARSQTQAAEEALAKMESSALVHPNTLLTRALLAIAKRSPSATSELQAAVEAAESEFINDYAGELVRIVQQAKQQQGIDIQLGPRLRRVSDLLS